MQKLPIKHCERWALLRYYYDDITNAVKNVESNAELAENTHNWYGLMVLIKQIVIWLYSKSIGNYFLINFV